MVLTNYNFRVTWFIYTSTAPLEKGMNTLPNMYKLCHFNLTMSPLYLVKLKITKTADRLLQHSVEPIVPKF